MKGFLADLFPGLALRRVRARILLEQATRVYDAAKASNYRARPNDTRSADGVMEQSRDKIRKWARHLDENHDLSIGVLDVLVNNIVGTGILVEPMVMTKGGKPAEKTNKELRRLHKEWRKSPEVTGELPDGEVQRLTCRTWLRDGEALVQHVRGPRFDHQSDVPYSIELIEADLLPFDAVIGRDRVIHGVEKNGWGRPLAYWLHRTHPGNDGLAFTAIREGNLKRVSADDIMHLKFTRRFRQTRGVSIFHGVITRLADMKDYEESERIAARIAANMTGYIKKGEEFTGEDAAGAGDRSFEMQAGMIFDNLKPGEDVGMIKSDRPNAQLGNFLATQHRAVASGTGTGYSSISKNYGGNYSAQRQELVEAEPGYGRLQEYFIEIFMRRTWREFVSAALASGVLTLSRSVDTNTIFAADMRAPGIPWIDPLKETQADVLAVEKRLASRTQTIRKRGGDPDVVNEQINQERERDRELEPTGPGAAQPDAGGGNGNEADTEGEDGDDQAARAAASA